jgi:AraC-like DNA-binding protein
LTPPPDALVVTPRPSAIARLWRLHAAAGRLAEEAPEVLANPDAARGLEQELTQAMVSCLSTADVQENRSAQRRHDRIIQRFHAVLEENIDRAFYIPDLCTSIGAPERTLRTCCLEYLGMGPKEYLRLRRMHMARHDLFRCDDGDRDRYAIRVLGARAILRRISPLIR